jgi:hypothetical protein
MGVDRRHGASLSDRGMIQVMILRNYHHDDRLSP